VAHPDPDDNASINTLILHGMHVYPIGEFVLEIRVDKRLQVARIVETESYAQSSVLGTTHRFLVVLVERDGKRNLWIRLDRLIKPNTGISGLLSRSCKTNPNDRVSTL
jgi:hypothetical protein